MFTFLNRERPICEIVAQSAAEHHLFKPCSSFKTEFFSVQSNGFMCVIVLN